MNDIDSMKATVRRYAECFNAGDADGLRGLFTADATVQGVLGSAPIEKAIEVWGEFHTAYAMQLEIVELCAEGDTVAARIVEHGHSQAPFRGEPVTAESYRLDAFEWFRFEGGKIAQRWGARDALSQRRQLKLPLT